MRNKLSITGLDIGTSKVASVTALVDANGQFSIIGQVTSPSRGVVRGAIVDSGETADIVSTVLKKLRDKVSGRLGDIYVNISGQDIKPARSKGMIPLSMRGREVTRADIKRCVDAAGTIHLPFDREIIHRIVQHFSVDDQPWIKNPLGLYAGRLSCEVFILSSNVNHIQNILKCVNNAGYDVKEIVFTGMADGACLLDDAQREEGAILIDMGASLTEASLFSGGALTDIDIMEMGAKDLSGDFRGAKILDEALSRISNMLDNNKKDGTQIGSIVLTGGMAFSDGFIEYVEDRLLQPVKMGVIKDLKGDISGLDSMRLATAIGLAKYAYEKNRKTTRQDGTLVGRVSSKMVEILNNYF